MGTSNDHGAQHDVFMRQASSPHGGAEFDAGFGLQEVTDTHGKLFDQFATRPGVDRYGEHYDEFGWTDMPALHGQMFDSDFKVPEALDGSDGHATWFDAFRGGTQVRYASDGSDYEGTVIDCNREYATVISREGKQHELLLSQVYAFRKGDSPANAGRPDRTGVKTAEPGNTPTDVVGGQQGEAPSAHSSAMGGGRRSASMAGTDTPFANKSDSELLDVLKAVKLPKPKQGMSAAISQHKSNLVSLAAGKPGALGNLACPGCGKAAKYHVSHQPKETYKGGAVTSTMHGHCKGCGFKHTFAPPKIGSRGSGFSKTGDSLLGDDVRKDVDATETATQAADSEAPAQAGKTWCPTCKHFCRKDEGGHCPTCGGKTTMRKSTEADADVLKRLATMAEAS